ncbi:MAG: c-type cytochrome [Rhodothalassiaceae bacterium]
MTSGRRSPYSSGTGKPAMRSWPTGVVQWASATVVVLLAVGLIALLVAATGIVNVSASAPHGLFIKDFLGFAKNRYVHHQSAQSPEPPPLQELSLIERGASHYANVCAACHAGPGVEQPAYVNAMKPKPPHMTQAVDKWNNKELFLIVRHGFKYAGMPAWPEPVREDEVWAVVAFIKQLPEMAPERYQALIDRRPPAHRRQAMQATMMPLAQGLTRAELRKTSPDGGSGLLDRCARCHGYNGLGSPTGAYPALGLQEAEYLYESLRAIKQGERQSGIMYAQLVGVSDEEMRALANYYAAQPAPRPDRVSRGKDLMQRGRQLALQGDDKVGACATCHNPDGENYLPIYPQLEGQHYDYMVYQLQAWKSGERGYSLGGDVMGPLSHALEDADVKAVSAFYAAEYVEDRQRPTRSGAPQQGGSQGQTSNPESGTN